MLTEWFGSESTVDHAKLENMSGELRDEGHDAQDARQQRHPVLLRLSWTLTR